MNLAAKLRTLLAKDECVVAPGAYDCITARLIEQNGFPVVYMSGGCTAGMLGFPDYGLTTMSEMVANAGRIAAAVEIPLIADADTGYGNELNVVRTVREYEQRGVAAFHIEDQVFPKKCGHLDGKQVIASDEFILKIKTAVAAKCNPDTVIIARTDALSVINLDEAVRRANAAADVGADIAFIEAPESVEETASIPKRVKIPCLMNVVRGGKSPAQDIRQIQQMGYRIAIVPGLLLQHIIGCCDEILEKLRDTMTHPVHHRDISVREMFRRMGSDGWDRIKAQGR
ncbi:MAG: isocitrate lyase/PEP mutase family protein [Alphaproteobacteria bacterium]|nr:isocitrate lyase/PEP mutase family protein [Alphaproteobacteria bacterium]